MCWLDLQAIEKAIVIHGFVSLTAVVTVDLRFVSKVKADLLGIVVKPVWPLHDLSPMQFQKPSWRNGSLLVKIENGENFIDFVVIGRNGVVPVVPSY